MGVTKSNLSIWCFLQFRKQVGTINFRQLPLHLWSIFFKLCQDRKGNGAAIQWLPYWGLRQEILWNSVMLPNSLQPFRQWMSCQMVSADRFKWPLLPGASLVWRVLIAELLIRLPLWNALIISLKQTQTETIYTTYISRCQIWGGGGVRNIKKI